MNNILKNDLNLFAAIGRERGIGAIDFERTIKRCLVVFAGIFVVVLAVFLIINGTKNNKVEKLEASIEALQADLQEIEQFKLEAEELQDEIDRFNDAMDSFKVSPRLTTTDIQNIAACMPDGMTLTSFSYSGQRVTMSVTGTRELMIADFANSLRTASDINKNATTEEEYHKPKFKSVTYAGVTKGADNLYTGSVVVDLNDIVIEEEPEPETEAPAAAE